MQMPRDVGQLRAENVLANDAHHATSRKDSERSLQIRRSSRPIQSGNRKRPKHVVKLKYLTETAQ